ncbi:MAG: ADP-ribosylglycohydrolase family protein [Myxococcota bacterium]
MQHGDRVLGALWGVALGDALGLPYEGLSHAQSTARYGGRTRFRLCGRTGYVSDDTEQTALLVQALVSAKDDDVRCLRRFRRSMVGWFLRLPFGIGGATLRACLRMTVGLRHPGVRSAGNGAAMRAGALGAVLAKDTARRRRLSRAAAKLTHTDVRAVESAVYVAELAALCAASRSSDRVALVRAARKVLRHDELQQAIDTALRLRDAPLSTAVDALGNTGFVVHTLGICTYCFLRDSPDPWDGIDHAIRAGGDTDTHAAIVGGWSGALLGARTLPKRLVASIHNGPFGPAHLEALAYAAVHAQSAPRWSSTRALLRNLCLYPVVVAHVIARPFRALLDARR